MIKSGLLFLLAVMFSVILGSSQVETLAAAEWSISPGGNAYRTAPAPGNDGLQRDGSLILNDPQEVYSFYFHVDRPAVLELALKARVDSGRSTIAISVDSKILNTVAVEDRAWSRQNAGRINVAQSGYVRVDLRRVQATENTSTHVQELLVSSDTERLTLDYVKSNEGHMFYWGRRGASVHLRYQVPQQADLQYAYSELTVAEGQDPIGSYFMANGFTQGYFGMQVNGPDQRRVLFSVWSPFSTDDPKEIPVDQQIKTLAQGPGVHVGKFGNEGSGGQSFLVYPWQAGRTYRFLTEVRPDGQGNTIYTSWFSEKTNDSWRLIASFLRPKTDTHLRGFHSFLENFNPLMGYLQRRVRYDDVWVRSVQGKWSPCTTARFTVDPTGKKRYRLDFSGGTQGGYFYLQNGGFTDATGNPGETFIRDPAADQPPEIDFDALPRE